MAGKLVHFEIKAGDVDRSVGFWSGIFGWQFGDSGMPGLDYRMTQTSPEQGGGIYGSEQPGGPLTIYFDTDDIDASRAKVQELGGSAETKQPVPGHGWFAACQDTEGTSFSLWQGDESTT